MVSLSPSVILVSSLVTAIVAVYATPTGLASPTRFSNIVAHIASVCDNFWENRFGVVRYDLVLHAMDGYGA